MRLSVAFLSASVLTVAVGCGTDTDLGNIHPGGGDAGTPNPRADAGSQSLPDAGPFRVGAHPPLPQIQNAGGPVLTSPKIVPIFFPSYQYHTEVMDLVNTIGSQPYWPATTSEYGVGSFVAGSAVDLTESAPTTIDDGAIQTWLKNKLTAGTLGTPSGSTIYTIFYPKSTTITQAFGTYSSCVQFGGYHGDFAYNSMRIPYAVIPQCDELNRQVGVDAVTAAASHEWVEAATDPYPHSTPAYLPLDSDHIAWGMAMGATENGDMCAIGIGQNYFKPTGYGHVIQRSWSNRAAATGVDDPCLPSVSTMPYFAAAGVYPDTVSFLYQFQSVTTKGVEIAVGSSKTIDVQVFSTAPMGDIIVKAVDLAAAMAQDPSKAMLTFAWDKTLAHNGDTLKLTITAVKAPGFLAPPATFVIVAKAGTPDANGIYPASNWWPGVVVNP